jgi:aminoglycoside 2'-N-acetyltransferase I
MDCAVDVRVARTEQLATGEIEGLRLLLDDAFGGSFSHEDWRHTMGGLHVLAADDEIVAHAAVVERLLVAGDRPLRTGYVEGVASAERRRGRGFGSAVLREASRIIQEDFELGALSTGVPGFFSRLGWEPWKGPTYVNSPAGRVRTADDDDGIMVLRTPLTRDLDAAAPLTCDWRRGDVW